jgi:ABC-type cobalt transport system substrate-binding protein
MTSVLADVVVRVAYSMVAARSLPEVVHPPMSEVEAVLYSCQHLVIVAYWIGVACEFSLCLRPVVLVFLHVVLVS